MKDTELIQFELFERYPDVLTVHQAREALGVGRTGVYKLIDQGLLKCFKIGNAYKIPKSALIEYVTNSCKGGA
jgi:excisionase family DNA binding protein